MDPLVPRACFINDDVWIGGAMKKASGVLPYMVDNPGFRSVQAHGSCEGDPEDVSWGCGFQANSSTAVRYDSYRAGVNQKLECEAYFNNFCCPEMCAGGIYTKNRQDAYRPEPDTVWGP